MTAPSYCVLEGDPANGIAPRRPDALCEDMGGLQFQDDPNDPPRPNEHLAAADFKQVEMLVQRAWRMTPVLKVFFNLSDTTPTIGYVLSCRDSLTTNTVTVARVSQGRYTITWPSGSLPPRTFMAESSSSFYGLTVSTEQTGNVVTVYAVDAVTGALMDYGSVSVSIFGE